MKGIKRENEKKRKEPDRAEENRRYEVTYY